MDLPIVIDCYFQNEESHKYIKMEEDLGVEVNIDLDKVFDLRPVHFFSIEYIFQHPNGKDTMIGSGVEDFRTPMKLKEVLKLCKS